MAASRATERAQSPRTLRPPSEATDQVIAAPGDAAVVAAPSRGGRNIAIRDGRQKSVVRPRRRWALGWLSFVMVVAVPVVIAAAYYYFIAADQYVAEFRFALRSAEPQHHDPILFFQDSVTSS